MVLGFTAIIPGQKAVGAYSDVRSARTIRPRARPPLEGRSLPKGRQKTGRAEVSAGLFHPDQFGLQMDLQGLARRRHLQPVTHYPALDLQFPLHR